MKINFLLKLLLIMFILACAPANLDNYTSNGNRHQNDNTNNNSNNETKNNHSFKEENCWWLKDDNLSTMEKKYNKKFKTCKIPSYYIEKYEYPKKSQLEKPSNRLIKELQKDCSKNYDLLDYYWSMSEEAKFTLHGLCIKKNDIKWIP